MQYTIAELATCLQEMREALIQDGSVISIDDILTISVEAKKKVLWHLDLLAAEVAGAEKHISSFQADDIFDQKDKDRMEQDVLEKLKEKLMLEDIIKNYSYCLRRHFQHLDDDDYPMMFGDDPRKIQLERRQVVQEVVRQVELIDRELDDFRGALCPIEMR